MMVDWNMETFSVVNGLAHGTASVMMNWNKKISDVMVYVCSQEYESNLFLLGEEGSYIPDKDVGRGCGIDRLL